MRLKKRLVFSWCAFLCLCPSLLSAIEIDPSLKQDSATIQDENKVYIANEDPVAAAKLAAASPNADPLVAVPQGPPRFREEWRKKFAADYQAAGGKGMPEFTVLRQPDTPTQIIPKKGGIPIDPEYKIDSPTRRFSAQEVSQKGGIPIDPEYKIDSPTNRYPAPAPDIPPRVNDDPHTRTPVQIHQSGSQHSDNFNNAMGALGKGMDGLDKAGQVAAGVQKEREKAAQDGVDFSTRNAAENVVGTAIGADSYNAGKKNAEAAIAKADKEGRSRWTAAGEALIKTGKDIAGITAAQEIFKEESDKEKKAADKEGREESSAGVVGMTAVRVAGDKIGLNPVLDVSMYDADADRAAGDTGRRAQEKVKDELEEYLRQTGELEQRMKRLKEREDMTNPSNRQWVRDLQNQYLQARYQAQEINNRTRGKMLDEKDPQLIAIRQAVDFLPENPSGVDMKDKELTLDEQVAAHDCSSFPNTKAGWNEAMGAPGCFCVEGFKFNQGETECVPDIGAQIKKTDCASITGSVALWNDSSQSAYCGCVQNLQMNAAGTACEPSDEVLQKAAAPITCTYPNSEQAWFRDERMFKCVCKAGFEWDKTGYACVEPGLAQVDCRHIKGATPVWYESTGVCGCAAGHVIENNTCVPSRETQLAQTNCSHISGTSPYWDEAADSPMCGCPPGQVIINNVCVFHQQQTPQPANGPDFGQMLGQLTNTYSQGTGNSDGGISYNPNLANGNWWGNGGNTQAQVPSQLPGLGASNSVNAGGAHAGFTGWGQDTVSSPSTAPGNPPPPAPQYNPPASNAGHSVGGVNTDAGDPCVTTTGRIC